MSRTITQDSHGKFGDGYSKDIEKDESVYVLEKGAKGSPGVSRMIKGTVMCSQSSMRQIDVCYVRAPSQDLYSLSEASEKRWVQDTIAAIIV